MLHTPTNAKRRVLATAALLAGVLLSTSVFTPAAWAADAAPAPAAAAPAAAAAAPAQPQGIKRISSSKMKIYKDALASAKNKNAASRQQLDKMHEELSGIIAAPTFDKSAYIAKNSEIDALNTQVHKTTNESTAAALAQFSPEERQLMARANKKGAKGAGKANKGAGKAKKKAAGKAKKKGASKAAKKPAAKTTAKKAN